MKPLTADSKTRILITVGWSLEDLKYAYMQHYGTRRKPSKQKIADWLGLLVTADVQNDIGASDSATD